VAAPVPIGDEVARILKGGAPAMRTYTGLVA
jgi:hypothetical protein